MIVSCYCCKEEKEFNSDNFPINKIKKDGLDRTCRVCGRKRASKYQKNNRDKVNKQRREREKIFIQNGRCTKCSQSADSNNVYSLCEKHFLGFTSLRHLGTTKYWSEIKILLESQNFKCAYSGVSLVLGKNASIDHIKSISQFPNLKNNLSNIHWVDLQVNLMKRELSEEKFLSIIKSIHEFKNL